MTTIGKKVSSLLWSFQHRQCPQLYDPHADFWPILLLSLLVVVGCCWLLLVVVGCCWLLLFGLISVAVVIVVSIRVCFCGCIPVLFVPKNARAAHQGRQHIAGTLTH
jgi:hypothetical protein